MTPIPILIISDSPDQVTGLARICRDLASNLVASPHFRVATFGRGGWGSNKIPFMQYNFDESRQWGEHLLERCWNDFAGKEKGIIFTIWDPSRLFWFALPQYWSNSPEKAFLTSGKFRRWGYFPVDSTGPGDRLSSLSADTIRAYDRVLAYTAWGARVLSNTLGKEVDWIPHGFNPGIFRPRDKKACKLLLGGDRHPTIGCVMVNTPRKDWGLAFATISELRKSYPELLFWCHVDVMERAWSIPALIADYGLGNHVKITNWMTDEELSYHYSACDLTILPSLGEGFGYPIVESLACGVPAVTGNYGGGAELIPWRAWLVEPCTFRLQTLHNCLRPVYRPEDWVGGIIAILEGEWDTAESYRESVSHLHWANLWPVWKKWFESEVKKEDGQAGVAPEERSAIAPAAAACPQKT